MLRSLVGSEMCIRDRINEVDLHTMVSYDTFHFDDLLQVNAVNLDQLTETYSNTFYGDYMIKWPEYQEIVRHPCGLVMGYVLGKVEGEKQNWHGHVSAVTVAPQFRRIGLGETLMNRLEQTSEIIHNAYFVDLFVRKSNKVAENMYNRLGYTVYRLSLIHISEPTRLLSISYAVFCLKKKK
eukprot:TRINITY_DN51246_c0_g1_i2.p1 TRINITY_DN51246_c0_g1~~TRINITY_DN51246_c0_g1_i2.p1  ORF type:complete len:181 (-),score=46.59 TRINITY_DN51246_c0_g1_i2:50-592(-)